jgi:ribonuclease E
VEAPAPASALTPNGRAPNDPREVRRRKREAERLQKEAEQAAAAAAQAPAAEPAPVNEAVEASPAPVAETTDEPAAVETAPVIDEPQHSAEEIEPRHTEALEKEHEPKPHA